MSYLTKTKPCFALHHAIAKFLIRAIIIKHFFRPFKGQIILLKFRNKRKREEKQFPCPSSCKNGNNSCICSYIYKKYRLATAPHPLVHSPDFIRVIDLDCDFDLSITKGRILWSLGNSNYIPKNTASVNWASKVQNICMFVHAKF